MDRVRTSQGLFLGALALLFAASVAATIAWSSSMSAMDGMLMPNGWTMSMAWMRMPGQSWGRATASFLGMWIVMMSAMMLPSLVPVLWRYRRALGATGDARANALTLFVGAGYFLAWAALGMIIFPFGVALAQAEMEWSTLARAVPVTAGVTVLVAGLVQFTEWKARHLACCRDHGAASGSNAGIAWRQGLRLGLHCVACCASLTAILLVIGMMDLRAMAVVSTAITFERLAPSGDRAARAIGLVAVLASMVFVASALGLIDWSH